jgi:hypothetical protein
MLPAQCACIRCEAGFEQCVVRALCGLSAGACGALLFAVFGERL